MLFRFELKKLVLLPAMIGFVTLCVVLNAVIAITGYNDYSSNYEVEIVNIFEGLKTSEIAETYIRKYGITGENAENIRNKYEKLQPVIDEKAANGDALSNYFGEQTYYRHGMLFKTMFMAIIAESCLLALFTALMSVTYENFRGTEHIISTTKVGRRVLWTKLCASLTAAIALTALILGVSLCVFFLRFNFFGVWNDNVSSMFNYAVNEYGKPFMTWHSFTVQGYLWSTIGITFGMVVCFCLLGYAAGVFVRNGYGSFIAAALVVGITFLTKVLFPIGSVSRAILGLTPIWLWKNIGMWFTDGGADIIWANFENVGLFVSLTVLSIIAFIATKVYKRRELL